jgi:hypothetical protein
MSDQAKGAKQASKRERRQQTRHEVVEFGMLWRPNGQVPHRIGPAVITNVSLGGVQFKARYDLQKDEKLFIELATEEGPVMLPGDVRYATKDESGAGTFGFRFQPESRTERQAVARWVLSLTDRDFVTGA